MSPIHEDQKHRYPPNWRAISNRIRWERAGGRCECRGECGRSHTLTIEGFIREAGGCRPFRHETDRCGEQHGASHSRTGSKVVLRVAHLDHQPENNAEENLRALCQDCSLRHDRDEHARVRAERRAGS